MIPLIKIIFLCSVTIFVSTEFATAQSETIDSLHSELVDEADLLDSDTSTVFALLNLAEEYRNTNLDSTYKYAFLALKISEELNFVRGISTSQQHIGRVYFNRGEYDKVYELAREAFSLIGDTGYKTERASLNQLMGLFYAAQGSYEIGLNYFFKANELFEKLGDEEGAFQNLNNIGVSYIRLEDYDKALEIFMELDSLNTLNAQTIAIHVNLGFIYYELDDYEKAELNIKRVLNFEGDNFDRRGLGLSYFKMGEIHRWKKEYDSALAFFQRSIEIFDELENNIEKVQSLNGIAITYLEQSEFQQALEFAHLAFEISTESNTLPERSTSAKTLFEIYKTIGEPEKSLEYHILFKSFSDSLHNNEVSKAVGRLEAEHENEKFESELILQQQTKNLETTQQLTNRNFLLIIAFSLLIITVVIAFFLYKNSLVRKKANTLLQEKNVEIEQQAAKLQEMNEIKTHLFSIISHDLRGPLSSLYGFITLNEMDALSKDQIQRLLPELSEKFNSTSNLLNNLLNWAKSQLEGYKVIPEKFELKEIAKQTLKLLSHKVENKNLYVTIDLDDVVHVYADKNMMELVLLNLLSNAIKFTPNKGAIHLTASEKENSVKLCIQDSGVGISEKKLQMLFNKTNFYSTEGTNDEKGTGLGLILCKDFVRQNKGIFSAESEVDKGSKFCFTLPKAESD